MQEDEEKLSLLDNDQSIICQTEDKSQKESKEDADPEKYYEEISVNLDKCQCISLNNNFYGYEYKRSCGYFCYSCCNEEICKYCFENCHANCNPKLKFIANLIGFRHNNRYACACNSNLFHFTKRKKYSKKDKNLQRIIKFDEIHKFLIQHRKIRKAFNESQKNWIRKLEYNEIIIKDNKNYLEYFNNTFNDNFLPEADDYKEYLDYFICCQYLIGKVSMKRDLQEIKPLSTTNFRFDNFLDILWFKKLIRNKIKNNYTNIYQKYFDKNNIEGEFSLSNIKTFIKNTTKISKELCKYITENIKKSNDNTNGIERIKLYEEDYLVQFIKAITYNLNLLIKYYLVDLESVIIIMDFIFEINVYLEKCGKTSPENLLQIDESELDEETKKKLKKRIIETIKKENKNDKENQKNNNENEDNNENIENNENNEISENKKSNIPGYPFYLSLLLYKCCQIYNIEILEDFITKGESERENMFIYSDYNKSIDGNDNPEIAIKNKCLISFLRLISNESNKKQTCDREMELNHLYYTFFDPFNLHINYLDAKLYFDLDFCSINNDKYQNMNKEIHKALAEVLYVNNNNFYIDSEFNKTQGSEENEEESEEDEESDEKKEEIKISKDSLELKPTISFKLPSLDLEHKKKNSMSDIGGIDTDRGDDSLKKKIKILKIKINELYEFVEIEKNLINPKTKLHEINLKKMKIYYDPKTNEEKFFDEVNDEKLIEEKINFLIYFNIDYTLSLTLSVIFNAIIPNQILTTEEDINEIQSLINQCLNILTFMTINSKGMKVVSIGKTIQLISNIIFDTYSYEENEKNIINAKKNDLYKFLYKKIYKFYQMIPINIKSELTKKLKSKKILSDPIIDILPIYTKILIREELNRLDDGGGNFIKYFYQFMEIHKNEFYITESVAYIEKNYNTKNNYENILLSDEKFKMSEFYFDLLSLISKIHTLFTRSLKPSKNFFHLLSIEKFQLLMKYEYLPLKKKSILLKAMLVILISPFKFYVNGDPSNCLLLENYNEDTEDFSPKLDVYLLVLIDEISKLNENDAKVNNKKVKNYYISILKYIIYFSNFFYTGLDISNFLLKNFYKLYLKLKLKEPILDSIILGSEIVKLDKTKFFEDVYEVDKENIDTINYSYDAIFQKIFDIIQKYKDEIKCIKSKNIFDKFFKIKKNFISYSNIDLRYRSIYKNYFGKLTKLLIQKNENNNKLITNIEKWKRETNSQIKNFSNYVIKYLFESESQRKLNFKYGINDNFPVVFFSLLNINFDTASLIILKISSQVLGNIKIDDFYSKQDKDKTNNSPIFLDIVMKLFIEKLYYYMKSYISITKLYSNIRIEKEICKNCLSIIKLFQALLENFNSTFIYYIFIKRYSINIKYEDFDKNFSDGFFEKVHDHNINFKIEKKLKIDTDKEIISYHSRNPPQKDFINKFKYYSCFFGFSINHYFSEPKPLFEYIIPLLEISADTIQFFGKKITGKHSSNPDSNYVVLFSALIDFLIECSSSFSISAVKIISNSLLLFIADYTPYKFGIFSMLDYSRNEKSIWEYVNVGLFSKIRFLDLVINLMISNISNKNTIYDIYQVIKDKNDKAICVDSFDKSKIGLDYFEKILEYFEILINKACLIIGGESNNFIQEVKNTEEPDQYHEKFAKFIVENKAIRRSMELELICKIFTYILILEYDHGYKAVKKHFEELYETGLYDKGKYNINSPISYIIYHFLENMCLVIKFRFRISDKIKQKVKNIKIYENTINENEKKEEKVGEKEENKKEENKTEEKKEDKENEDNENEEEEKEDKEDDNNIKEGEEEEDENVDMEEYIPLLKEKNIIVPVKQDEINKVENEEEFDDSKHINQKPKTKYAYFIRPFSTYCIGEDKIAEIINDLDHSSHESKIFSLMSQIDYLCLYMNLKASIKKEKRKDINYSLLETINNIYIFILNILLLTTYYVAYDKKIKESELNEKKSARIIYLIILVLIHIVFCIIVFCLYFKYTLIFTQIKELSEISNDFKFRIDEEKIIKEKYAKIQAKRKRVIEGLIYDREIPKYKLNFLHILFNDVSKYKIYLMYFKIFLTPNSTIALISWSMIFDILFLITNLKIFIVIPILFIAHSITTVKDIMNGLKTKWHSILLTFYFEILIIVVFMWLAFLYFPQQIISSVKNENGEEIKEEESFCNSTQECLLYFLSNGLIGSGTNDITGTISYKKAHDIFITIFFYNFIAFILIGVIFSNIFTGLITDAFSEFRQKTEQKNESLKNQCFICNMTRNDCENEGMDFEFHRKNVHSVSHYFYFLSYLYTKNSEDFNIIEKSIWDSIKSHDISWLPFEEF